MKDTKGYSIAALVCGILGLLLFLMPYFGIWLSIAGIVFGTFKPRNGMSVAGLVLGILGVCINIMTGLLALAVLSLAA